MFEDDTLMDSAPVPITTALPGIYQLSRITIKIGYYSFIFISTQAKIFKPLREFSGTDL